MKVSLFDLLLIYETEVKKNVRNKKKILDFEKHKMEYLVDIKNVLENNLYDGGKYNIFLVFEPKVRVIMAQGIYDKIINHYVTRFILIPKLEKYLNNRNCATRKGMGTSYAIKLLKNDIESFKKYDKFYFLKLDISKYFYSLDHEVIISIIKQDLTQDELNLVKIILDSTNKEYINKKIEYLEKKYNVILLKYEYKMQDNSSHISGYTNLSIEHVLPQTPEENSQWCKDFSEEERNFWTHNIANLILINFRKNSALSNSEFDVKKKILKEKIKDKFQGSYEVLNENNWSIATLKERQKRILKELFDYEDESNEDNIKE